MAVSACTFVSLYDLRPCLILWTRTLKFYGLKSAHQGSQGEYRPLLLELFTIRHTPVTAIDKCPTIYSRPYTVEVQASARIHFPSNRSTLKLSDLRPTKRLAMRKYLEEVNFDLLVGNNDSYEEKSNTLETVIKTGMGILLPLKPKRVPANEPPWVNKKLKSLIHDRQSALSRGDTTNFRHLRNSVNRYRKSCRAKYYAAKVEHLRDCEPRRWWKEVKKNQLHERK